MKSTKLGIIFYRIFSRAYFHLPFLTIFFYKKEYNIFQISCILAVYGCSALFSSIFIKSILKAKLSSKYIIILSEMMKLLGLFILIYFNNLSVYVIAQILLGMSYSIATGVDTEIIYSEIKDKPMEFQAKSNSYMFNTLLISGLIGSWLFNKNIELPFIATFTCTIIGIIGFSINIQNHEQCEADPVDNNIEVYLNSKEKELILSYAFLRGIILTLFTGFLPFYFFVNIDLKSTQFILILTCYTLVGSFSSKKLPQYKGNTIMISIIALFIALFGYFVENIYIMIFSTILLGMSSGCIRPVVANALKEYGNTIYALDKAEILYSLINIILLLLGGRLYLVHGFKVVLVVFIVTLLIYLLLLYFLKEKGKNNEN